MEKGYQCIYRNHERFFTYGNVADNNLDIMVKLFGNLKGYVFADKGFINAKASESLMNKGLLLDFISCSRFNIPILHNKLFGYWVPVFCFS
ncbi:hypothetical protein ACUN24_20830 [Pedobacter sp. WC2501]|uniref:hypothetical protein n=1 Tax=Pedobacter sp. WC2501 TaxID=3461400 RepID=UPI00404525E4